MEKNFYITLFISVLLAGCAGRQPEPVSAYYFGDENKSCETLKKEIGDIQKRMLAILPKTDKTVLNTLWTLGGTVISYTPTPAATAAGFVPYLFVDMKDAERIEYNALARRHNRLLLIAQSKSCDMNDIRAEPIPTINEKAAEDKKSK